MKERLENHEKRISELEKNNSKPAVIEIFSPVKEEGFFDIEGDNLTLLKKTGEKSKDITQNIALLVLYGYKKHLNVDKVLGTEVRRNVAINKVRLENFGTYLGELIPSSILRQGKVGSVKVTYKLTPFGEAKAKELIEIIKKNEGKI